MSYEQNTLDLVPVIFGAGQSKMFNMSGNYFELIDCPDPVDVVLSDAVGGQRVRMKQGEASFYSKGVSFSVVQITSATAQTVRFIYGTGEAGTRRSTGSVSIAGTPTVILDATTLAALAEVKTDNSFSSNAGGPAASAVQVVAPGANVNGMWVTEAYILGYNSGSTQGISLLAKNAAPANTADGHLILAFGAMSASINTPSILQKKVWVPAGLGLYFFNSVADSGHAGLMRSCRWKFA